MKSTDQKLIMINGWLNSGKSLLFNILKKEGNFICLDLSRDHFEIYENDLINDLGKKNVDRIKPFIESTKIYMLKTFFKEIGRLIKLRPGFHFVIKPGSEDLAFNCYREHPYYEKYANKYSPLKMENIHHLMVFRHPKMAWATVPIYKANLEHHINEWLIHTEKTLWEAYDMVKIEKIKDHALLKTLIKRTDINKIKPYTNYDLQVQRLNDYSSIQKDFNIIEKRLAPLFKQLEYDFRSKHVKMFLQDSLTTEEMKIDWLTNL